jgi:hypothetical protein
MTQVFNKSRFGMQESNYNFRLIWRLLNIISDQLEDHKFLPGEVHLQAIKKETRPV